MDFDNLMVVLNGLLDFPISGSGVKKNGSRICLFPYCFTISVDSIVIPISSWTVYGFRLWLWRVSSVANVKSCEVCTFDIKLKLNELNWKLRHRWWTGVSCCWNENEWMDERLRMNSHVFFTCYRLLNWKTKEGMLN